MCCLFDTGDGGPEQVSRLDGVPSREMVSGPVFPGLAAVVDAWPGPGQ
ncbi:hypothetical protein ACIO87_25390 [Streptomyces sp. NPDC087218]